MIFVITNDDDHSSNKIIEWLDFFEVDYCRLNQGVDKLFFNSVLIEREGQITNKIVPNFFSQNNELNITFFRRGRIWGGYWIKQGFGKYKDRIDDHLKKEAIDLKEFIYNNLNISEINSPINYRVNKLTALKIAANSGLLIPKTIVTNSKAELINAFPDQDLICKPITDNLIIEQGAFKSSHSPKRLGISEIKNLPDSFGYSLFQELIETKWEIRTFVFGDLIKSIAIINSEQNGNISKELFQSSGRFKRIIPVELPKEILDKIKIFMNDISLLTGSIDFLYSKDNNFYFLEVNPVGQFDHVSYFGNFPLERLIAEKLITYHEERQKYKSESSSVL